MTYEQVKQAADNVDAQVISSVYPSAFLERWSQYAQYGADMPKSAAELDTLIEAAVNVSNVKRAHGEQGMYSKQIAAVSDMAKRAAYQTFGAPEANMNNYDLSGAIEATKALM